MYRLSPLTIAFVSLVSTAIADTVTINPSADTTLFERDPDNNWGAQTENVAGTLGPITSNKKARLLLNFDIAGSVPAGSTITSVSVNLRVTKTPGDGGADTNFQLLRVLAPWVEGTKSSGIPGGAAATNGETTWASRLHHQTTGMETPWGQPGGAFEDDYAEDPSASQFIDGVGNYIFNFLPGGVNDVQSMLDLPAGNFGWVLVTVNETVAKSARRFGAREHATNPPQLEITFTPPPPPPFEILSAERNPISGELTVQFYAQAGLEYSLQTRTDLASGSWIDVVDAIVGNNEPITIMTTPLAGTKRLFFRIIVL